MSELLDVARQAADAAAPGLLAVFRSGAATVSSKSTPTDLVSEADHAAEEAIRAVLRARRPDDAILGEEGDDVPGTSGLRWVVDPLDGTVNFLFGHPQWCISVACEHRCGTIVDPVRGERFEVAEDGTATLDGAALRGSARAELATALVATGFGYDAEVRRAQAEVAARVLPRARDIRRAGSAALDLAWCAAGRMDAYWEFGVQPWDTAAGLLLCRAAGLEVRELAGSDRLPPGVLVAPPGLVEALEALVTAS